MSDIVAESKVLQTITIQCMDGKVILPYDDQIRNFKAIKSHGDDFVVKLLKDDLYKFIYYILGAGKYVDQEVINNFINAFKHKLHKRFDYDDYPDGILYPDIIEMLQKDEYKWAWSNICDIILDLSDKYAEVKSLKEPIFEQFDDQLKVLFLEPRK